MFFCFTYKKNLSIILIFIHYSSLVFKLDLAKFSILCLQFNLKKEINYHHTKNFPTITGLCNRTVKTSFYSVFKTRSAEEKNLKHPCSWQKLVLHDVVPASGDLF